MPHQVEISVENKLTVGERDINVFHYASHSGHIISHNSCISVPLGNAGDGDYLHVSVVKGPGYLWMDCVISLPLWLGFDFSSEGKMTVSRSADGSRTLLKIPPGPPTWELKITYTSTAAGLNGGGSIVLRDDESAAGSET